MPKEPIRTLRCDDELWTAAQAKAAEDGWALSAVIRKALAVYAYGEPPGCGTYAEAHQN